MPTNTIAQQDYLQDETPERMIVDDYLRSHGIDPAQYSISLLEEEGRVSDQFENEFERRLK